jgi:uncharacterized membrane protein YphA (DoxX/SURF4 family)
VAEEDCIVTSATGLRVLSILLGVFVLCMGLDKINWLMDSDLLLRRLQEWRGSAPAVSRWYLDAIAIPGAPVFARLVLLGELAAGAALICGVRVRMAAAVTFVMVLNFHFASDVLLHYSYLTNAYGLPVLGGLLALAIGGSKLPFSLGK